MSLFLINDALLILSTLWWSDSDKEPPEMYPLNILTVFYKRTMESMGKLLFQ